MVAVLTRIVRLFARQRKPRTREGMALWLAEDYHPRGTSKDRNYGITVTVHLIAHHASCPALPSVSARACPVATAAWSSTRCGITVTVHLIIARHSSHRTRIGTVMVCRDGIGIHFISPRWSPRRSAEFDTISSSGSTRLRPFALAR